MDEYPSNSQQRPKLTESKTAKTAKTPDKVEKAISGHVVRRKKSLLTRFKETFTGDNNQSVFEYVVFDTIIPYAKDMVADAVQQGVERTLFGEARSSSRRPGARQTVGNYVNYNKPVWQNGGPGRPDPRGNNRRRGSHNIDEVLFQTRPEAIEILDRLASYIEEYGQASVSNFYDLVGEPATYIDEKWGWMDLGNASATRVRDGYILNLPRPEPLD